MVKGTVALVTGGGRGIGLAIIEKLLENGAIKVYIGDINVEIGEAAEKTLNVKHGNDRVKFLKLDVSNFDEFKNVFETIIEESGRLDILLNNAGILVGEKLFDINIGGVLNGLKLAMVFMKEGSKVINTASRGGFYGHGLLPEYIASKHAVIGLTRSFATDHWFKQTGISVMAICPGYTDSSILNNQGIHKEILDYFQQSTPQNPEIVATGIITMLKTGTNGSFWVVNDSIPAYEVEILARKKENVK